MRRVGRAEVQARRRNASTTIRQQCRMSATEVWQVPMLLRTRISTRAVSAEKIYSPSHCTFFFTEFAFENFSSRDKDR